MTLIPDFTKIALDADATTRPAVGSPQGLPPAQPFLTPEGIAIKPYYTGADTAGLDFMHTRYPDAPLWAAGMSFGSWIALNVGAADERVSALLGIAIPASRDFSAVAGSTKPKFFIHGERDELCPLQEVRTFYAGAAEPKELVVIDAAGHLFDGKVGEVADAIEDLLIDWGIE